MSKKSKIGEPFYERQELEEAGFASFGENVLIKKMLEFIFLKIFTLEAMSELMTFQ